MRDVEQYKTRIVQIFLFVLVSFGLSSECPRTGSIEDLKAKWLNDWLHFLCKPVLLVLYHSMIRMYKLRTSAFTKTMDGFIHRYIVVRTRAIIFKSALFIVYLGASSWSHLHCSDQFFVRAGISIQACRPRVLWCHWGVTLFYFLPIVHISTYLVHLVHNASRIY